MKQLFGLLIFVTVCSTSQAVEGFSIQNWQSSFSSALSKNDSQKIQDLINIKKLEEKAIPTCVDCESKQKVKKARQLFEKGQHSQALNLYNQIPKASDIWLEAVEERGWAQFRMENFEKALAQTKTLLSPQFIGIVNSEAFFLQSLSQLRICDYEGILNTHQVFKEKQRTRISEIQNLAKTGANEALQKSIKQLDQFPLTFENFGENLSNLPHLFYRDLEVQRNLLKIKISQAGLSALSAYPNSSLDSHFIQMKSEGSEKLKNRMKILAQRETEKNSKIVQKLNLVEIEAIQRIHTDMKLSESMYKSGKFKETNQDQLIFMDDGQPWIDELDKYDVAAKTCAKSIRRKM